MMLGIRQLCALSIFCGLVLLLTPEGTVKRVTSVGCAAVMLLSVLSTVGSIDMSEYAVEMAKYREQESRLRQQAGDMSDRLNRSVIEAECEAYILDKAAELGLSDLQVDLTARWSMDGVWVPSAVRLTSVCSEAERRRLSERIEAELGIPADQQEWSDHEGQQGFG